MPSRILVAQNTEDSQVLRTDNRKKVIVCSSPDWQFLFGPYSELSESTHLLRVAVELDPDSLDYLRFVAYLYNPTSGGVDNAASCQFRIYKVVKTGWQEQLIATVNGTQQPNQYFYAEKTLQDLSAASLDGESTLMIEVFVTRLSEAFTERVYVNHLGIYENVVRLRKQVEFLDLTKADE